VRSKELEVREIGRMDRAVDMILTGVLVLVAVATAVMWLLGGL
jgi:hypothetical protein